MWWGESMGVLRVENRSEVVQLLRPVHNFIRINLAGNLNKKRCPPRFSAPRLLFLASQIFFLGR